MKPFTLNEVKKELSLLEPKKILEVTIRLAKYKKENKELLGYLLFEAHDEDSYVEKCKEEIRSQVSDMNHSNIFLAKKTIRKMLRTTNKFIKYSGLKKTEVELRIYFCLMLKESGIAFRRSPVLLNLYENQIKKIQAALETLHEDLRYDYADEVKNLV
jgi:hypothetical protein